MTLEEAIEIVLAEAKESGYLISAEYNAELVSRDINISVDAENDTINAELNASIKATVETFVDENELAATYKQLESKGREHFEEIVKRYNPMITDEELEQLSYEDLLEMVELATIEKAQMASIALEEYYLSFKEKEFKFKYKQEIAEQLNPIIGAAYKLGLDTIKAAMDVLDKIEYDLYVSEESQYIKLMNQLNSYKDKNIKLNAQLAVNENIVDINAQINANNELIDKIMADIEKVMNSVKTQITAARNALNEAYLALESIEEQIKDIDFAEILKNVEVEINSSKAGLCADFEAEFADDIANIKVNIQARKDYLEGKTKVE
jgi:hypothetical protein